MTALPPAEEWGYSMDPPLRWGDDLREWLDATPPVTREDVDTAHRAMLRLRSDVQYLIDVLDVEVRRHDAELELTRRLQGDEARDPEDIRGEQLLQHRVDTAIAAAAEAEYRASIEVRSPLLNDETPRGDRDLPGYDRRVFGADEADAADTARRPRRPVD